MIILQLWHCSFQTVQGGETESVETAESCQRSQRASCAPSLKIHGVFLGGSRYESQDVHLQMYECSWANSKPASLYRERRITEATPRLQNFKHTPADPISLCGHFTYSALRRYERLSGVFIRFPKQLYVFTKETLFWTGVVDCEHDLIQPGVSQSA